MYSSAPEKESPNLAVPQRCYGQHRNRSSAQRRPDRGSQTANSQNNTYWMVSSHQSYCNTSEAKPFYEVQFDLVKLTLQYVDTKEARQHARKRQRDDDYILGSLLRKMQLTHSRVSNRRIS